MASVCHEPNGRKRIVFSGLDRKRRTLRMGLVADAVALDWCQHITNMIEAARNGVVLDGCDMSELQQLPRQLRAPAMDAANWLAQLPQVDRQKLATVGLIAITESPAAIAAPAPTLLGEFLDAYLERRTDAKPATRIFYGHTARNLREFFGSSRTLESITAAEGTDFERWLGTTTSGRAKRKLASATVARRCSLACTFFRDALRRRLITENPFTELKGGSQTNPKRQRFINVETIDAVLEACPDAEWRALVALARYGGLRVPSEPMLLTWDDIDWAGGRMVIHSPKTEHHEGKGVRVCPLFPELLGYLEALFDAAPKGQTKVFRKIRPSGADTGDWKSANLRTQFERIIKRAGLVPWPRLWHNLRSTRQTELTDRFPSHVVAAWLGNSEKIANAHYLQLTDEHWQRATGPANPARNPARLVPEMQGGARSGAQATSKNQLENEKPLENEGSEWAIQDSNL